MGTWLSCECSGHTKHEPKKLTAMKQPEKSGSIPARAVDPLFRPSLFIYDMRSPILNFNHRFAFAQEDFFYKRPAHFLGRFVLVQYIPQQPKLSLSALFQSLPCYPRFWHKTLDKIFDFLQPMMTQTNSNSEVHDNDPPRRVTHVGSSIFFISLI